MASRVSQKYTIRFLSIVAFILIGFILNCRTHSLTTLVIFLLGSYILCVLNYRINLDSWKNVFISIEFMFITCYLCYSLFAPLIYILDGLSARTPVLRIKFDDVYETVRLYLNIFLIYSGLSLLLGNPRKSPLVLDASKYKIKPINTNIGDAFAVFCTLFFLYLFLRNGFSIFSYYIRDIRALVATSINQYVYIYMVAYSFGHLSSWIIDGRLKSCNFRRLLIMLIFWSLSLFIDRRYFILLFFMLVCVVLLKIKKIRFKIILPVVTICVIFLLSGYLREGYLLGETKFGDTLYMSTAEFVLPEYVSVYYLGRLGPTFHLLYGLSYTYYVLAYFIPGALFPGKPKPLSVVFMNEAGTNVGFAFNPVAEGLVNFGQLAVFIVPIIFLLYNFVGNKIGKKNPLIYLLMFGYCINFMRGMMAVCVFEIVLYAIVFKLFFNVKFIKHEDFSYIANV